MGYSERPTSVVAKIYDPLLHSQVHILRYSTRLDVVDIADGEYATEASAYAELHEAAKTKPIIKDFVPRFYGTWTTMIKNTGWGKSNTRPAEDDSNGILHERPVRIILIEYIEGKSISDNIDYLSGSYRRALVPPAGDTDHDPNEEAKRLDIFARILHGLVALDHVGVIPHHHMPATKFIIEKPNSPTYVEKRKSLGKHRVVLIGFGAVEVTRCSEKGPLNDEHFPRPRHPACSQNTPQRLHGLYGWYYHEWPMNWNMFSKWVRDGNVFDAKDFTCEDEIGAIVKRLNAERGCGGQDIQKADS
ncbi:hypothetical protein F5X68DRAFT_260137 [Plectosphaerella plurivora]|uniref:Protein kinase domain-containing protein n=1 Tax=Plectosphaerella plurivora TaxID=936078 RepID=A0A9P9AE40_9PEZI|nr:hypothetical protein F5X68DRAFT_260137 [Plectosphaerella plurivora]